MIGLLGKKLGMTQIFEEDGTRHAVTVLQVGPCYVSAIKEPAKDGYSAVQLAYEETKERRLNRPKLGHLKRAKLGAMRVLKEIRTEETEGLSVGAKVGVDNFEVGDMIDVQGISIGRGFQGVVKRHHFKGGEASHGAKFGRESGSISQGSAYPSRVPKGRRMAGQMGNEKVTTQNLKILKVDLENNLVAVGGSVPGSEDGIVVIKSALKKGGDKKWKVTLGTEAAKKNKKADEQKIEETEEKGEKAAPAKTQEAPEAKKDDKPDQKS